MSTNPRSAFERFYVDFARNRPGVGVTYKIVLTSGATLEGIPWTAPLIDMSRPTFFFDSESTGTIALPYEQVVSAMPKVAKPPKEPVYVLLYNRLITGRDELQGEPIGVFRTEASGVQAAYQDASDRQMKDYASNVREAELNGECFSEGPPTLVPFVQERRNGELRLFLPSDGRDWTNGRILEYVIMCAPYLDT